MTSAKPKAVHRLASVFERPSPVTREVPPAAATGAGPRTREGDGTDPGRDLTLAARAVVVAIARLAERREALAAVVAAARASELSDDMIRSHLVVNGLGADDVDAALA
jgi:hypothetical protein